MFALSTSSKRVSDYIVFLVLLKWEVGAILENGCGVKGQMASGKQNVGGERLVRWEGGKRGRVVRWEVPRFIQKWGTQGEFKILYFCF